MKYNPTLWQDFDTITKQRMNEPLITLEDVVNNLNTLIALSEAIMGSMYQAPTFTQYVTTITPDATVSGSITDATILQILGNNKLSELTPVGTDDNGNNEYAVIFNGATIGNYTKDAVLSDIMSDINNNDQAAVSVSYSEAENIFVFTSKQAGAGGKIEIDSGLAGALFDSSTPIDFSTKTFVESYGIDWLLGDRTAIFKFTVENGNTLSITIGTLTTIGEVINQLNDGFQQQAVFSYNKYTGEIEARTYKNNTLVKLIIIDKSGDDVYFDTANAPANPFTYGKNGIFTNIKLNGKIQPIIDKEVDIRISTSSTST